MLNKKDRKYILLLGLLVLVFFSGILIYPKATFYPSMDLVQQHYFWKYFTVDSFKTYNELPLWNPHIFGGMSFIGNPVTSLFYPLNILFFILPLNLSFTLVYVLQAFIAGLFMYLFLKEFKLSRFSSFIGSLIFTFSAMMIVKISHGNFTQFLVASLIPLVFYSAELLLKYKKNIFIILLGFSLSLQMLAGHQQLFFYSSFTLALYICLKIIFNINKKTKIKEFLKEKSKVISKFFIAFLIGILLSSIIFFPSLESVACSSRSSTSSNEKFVESFAMHPKHMITMVLPYFFGSEIGFPSENTFWGAESNGFVYLYIGILPLFFLLVCLLFLKRKEKHIFTIMAIVSLLIMLGFHTFVYPLIFKIIPGFNLFRGPQKFFTLFVFSTIILASFGLDRYFKDFKKKNVINILNKIMVIAFVLLIIIIPLFVTKKDFIINKGETVIENQYEESSQTRHLEYYLNRPKILYKQILINLYILSGLMLSLLLINYLRFENKNIKKYLKWAIFIIILADLWYVSLPLLEITKNNTEIFEKNDIIKFLNEDELYFRVLDQTTATQQELAVRYNIQKLSGYEPIVLRTYSEFINLASGDSPEIDPGLHEINPQFAEPETLIYSNPFDLMNTKYIILKKAVNLNYLKLVYKTNFYDMRHDLSYDVYVYENKKVLPRAFIVRDAEVIKDKEKIFEELRTFNPKEKVILEEDFENLENKGTFKEADITYYSPNKIIINVSLKNPGFLLLSENYYPGWKAYDNGKKVNILKADYILRAIYLEKGNHVVKFVYDPLSYKIGKISTLLSLLALSVYFILCFRNWRRER